MMEWVLSCDRTIFCIVNSHHAPFWDGFFWAVTWLGNGWVITPILLSITFFAIPRKRYPLFLAFAACGMIVSGIANTQIKNAVQRPRPLAYFSTSLVRPPDKHDKAYAVHVVGEALSFRSFPSGHSNTAFCGACVLAFFIGGWYWSAFMVAFLVAYSRVYLGVHFPIDVAAGAVLAFIVMAITLAGYRLTARPREKR
jgi:undecaprenyl-diphosphatase